MRTYLRAVRAIAGQDLLDVTRQRGTWLLLVLLPLFNVLFIVALPGIMSEREREQRTRETFTVAVDGSPSDVDALRTLLEPALLRIVPSPDPADAVKDKRAHVGVVVPEGAALPDASSVASPDASEVRLRVVALGTRATSRIALGRTVATMEAYRSQLTERDVEARGLPPRVARPIVVDAVDLSDTDLGGRLSLSVLLPLVMLFPLIGAVSLAAQRVSGGKDQRVMEPLLLLPVPRSAILVGKAVAGYAIGLVMLPSVGVPLLLGRLLPVGEAGREVSLDASTVLAVLAVALVVLAFLVAMGACLGAAARTSAESGSIAPFAMVPVMVVAFVLNTFQVRTVVALTVLPLIGPTLVARDIVAGGVELVHVVIAVSVTSIFAIALVAFSGRLLESDRSVLRPTS